MESIGHPLLWAVFIAFVLAMLALDLGVFHRRAHVVRLREAAIWSAVWVSLALLFNLGIWWRFGGEPAIEFLSGYLIEKSLSIDNIFVFVIIFTSLRIPALYQHRILFWGILTALVLRAMMIFAGVAALARFHWLIYVFGGFLIFTGAKLLLEWRRGEEHEDVGWGVRALRRIIPSTDRMEGQHFFARVDGKRVATPLLLALLLVEVTDVVFALDSIPAIFAVTRDPFIVFTSNIFAILGLRSMFFLLGGVIDKFRYLKLGLSAVLVFVGAKMIAVEFVKLPPALSLGVIALLLGASIIGSLVVSRRQDQARAAAEAGPSGSDPDGTATA
jgi:tellurite resistance protein TerC